MGIVTLVRTGTGRSDRRSASQKGGIIRLLLATHVRRTTIHIGLVIH